MPVPNIRRALLINPHWSTLRRQRQGQFRRAWPPLDLALAAQLLENAGIEAVILDNNIEHRSPADIGRLAETFDIVFATSSPYDRWQCPALDITFFYDTIRHVPRERLIVMGAHVSERLDVSLRATGARAAIIHEPEATILDICVNGNPPWRARARRARRRRLWFAVQSRRRSTSNPLRSRRFTNCRSRATTTS
jgi:hypothetical protein